MLLKPNILVQLFLFLVFLISSCQINERSEERSEIDPAKKDSLYTPFHHIQKKGIYVIDKNWNKSLRDSILKINKEYVLIKGENDLLFVTNNNDSIQLSIARLNRKNPIIIFNEIDSPIITSLDRIAIYIDENEYQKITPDTIIIAKIPKSTMEKKPVNKSGTREDTSKPKIHSPIYYSSIELKTHRKLKKRNLWVNYQYFPLIPDKKILEIYFDNDFWDYTDYYYTNGIRLGFIHPIFSNSPLSYLLVSNATNGLDYYGVQLVQHMYTGSQPKVDTTIPGDRPWAAYSIIGQYAISFDWAKKIKHESEINIGVLGPKSGGGFLQDLVHTVLPNNSPPEGWENQIKTDIILDYQYRINTSLFEAKYFESYLKASVQVGTLRDNLKWGIGAKYGVFTPFYKDFQNQAYQKKVQKTYFSIFGDIETQLIGYDATLQGGVTDRTSIYVIPTRNMERFVIQGFLGLEFTYKKIHLQFIQYWKSKEFKTGKDHKYVSARLYIGF